MAGHTPLALGRLIRHLRLRPFPLDTEAGRSAERYRRALLTMLSSTGTRVLNLALMVASVTWTVPYLGAERFGLWMTIASFAAMLSFMDLGIGNALTNRVAQASTESRDRLRQVIGGGLLLLAGVSIAVYLALWLAASALPWDRLLKLPHVGLAEEAERTLHVFAAGFSLSVFCTGVARVLHGLQRGFEVHLAGAGGLLCGLIALYFAAAAQAAPPVLLACVMGAQVLGNLLLLPLLAIRGYLSMHATRQGARAEIRHLLRVGGFFLLLQIGTMVGFGADSFIISAAAGPVAVAAYAVTQRMMQLIGVPLSTINAPLWAAYADARVRGDKDFIRRTLSRSLRICFAYSLPMAVLLAVVGDSILSSWTSGQVEVPAMLLLLFCAWAVADAIGNAFSMFLNGVGVVRAQVFVAGAFVLLGLPAKIIAAGSLGAAGVVCAGLIVYLLVTLTGYGVVFRKEIAARLR